MRKTFVRTVHYNTDQTNYQPSYNYMLQLDEEERVIALWREIAITEDGTCCMHCYDFPVRDGIHRTADIEQLIRDSQGEPLYDSKNEYYQRSTRSMGRFREEDELEEMTMEVAQLKEESAKLKKENESLNNAIAQLKDENQMLVEENTTFKSNTDQFRLKANKARKKYYSAMNLLAESKHRAQVYQTVNKQQEESIGRQAEAINLQKAQIEHLMKAVNDLTSELHATARRNQGLALQLYGRDARGGWSDDSDTEKISEEMEII